MSKPVALITGGANGIGFAVAEHLILRHGYRVSIIDVNAESGKAAATQLNAAGDNCLFLRVDVTDYRGQAEAFQKTFEWGGNRLDLFFANAGIGDSDSVYKDLFDLDEKTGLPKPLNLKVLDVNLNAVLNGVNLARHFLTVKNSDPSKGGKIWVTSSCVGLYPNHCIPLYTASKHALIGFVRSTAPVLAGLNISINAILPTLIETNLMPEAIRPLWDRSELTPMSTALKAVDAFMEDDKLTGQTVELCLEDLVFSKQQPFATPNSKYVCERIDLWEAAGARILPKPPGENYALPNGKA